MTDDAMTAWWGEHHLAQGEVGCWQVGTLTLWVEHGRQEWRIGQERAVAAHERAGMETCAGIPAQTAVLRFGAGDSGGRVKLLPLLADRQVIARLAQPLHVLPGEAVTLYVSSPLWLAVHVGEPPRLLHETPVIRPSDTWFGPPVKEGGLCYAAGTRAQTDVQALRPNPLRAVTPVHIRNVTDVPFHLERINLPAPFLALYRADNGILWTDAVTLTRQGDEDALATLRLDNGLPPQARAGVLLATPRRQVERSFVLFQALSRIFYE
jgi:hypothetical protein